MFTTVDLILLGLGLLAVLGILVKIPAIKNVFKIFKKVNLFWTLLPIAVICAYFDNDYALYFAIGYTVIVMPIYLITKAIVVNIKSKNLPPVQEGEVDEYETDEEYWADKMRLDPAYYFMSTNVLYDMFDN